MGCKEIVLSKLPSSFTLIVLEISFKKLRERMPFHLILQDFFIKYVLVDHSNERYDLKRCLELP